jgi:hypothetical protein
VPHRPHHCRQLPQLRALPSPVEPFKRYKFPASRHLRNDISRERLTFAEDNILFFVEGVILNGAVLQAK